MNGSKSVYIPEEKKHSAKKIAPTSAKEKQDLYVHVREIAESIRDNNAINIAKKKENYLIESYNSYSLIALNEDLLVVEAKMRVIILNRHDLNCLHKLFIDEELKSACISNGSLYLGCNSTIYEVNLKNFKKKQLIVVKNNARKIV